MEPLGNKVYRCGEIEVIPARGAVRVLGAALHLRPKSFEMLEYLISNRNRLVAKNELLDRLWKNTAVNENSPAQCVIELRKALGDDARNPRFIKTISKLGYQFIGPVEETIEAEVASIEIEEVISTNIEIKEGTHRGWFIGAGIAAALIGLLALWRVVPGRPETSLRAIDGERPVLVMYFENQSRSPELDWLREGLADMLITDLSRSPKLNVLSRQQLALSLARSGHSGPLDLSQAMEIARGARASQVILGSFAQLGAPVRITVLIVNVSDGRTIATESITAAQPAQILTQIDTLALELAADLGAPMGGRARTGGLAALMTNSLEAYHDYSSGLEMAYALHTGEAIDRFQKAIAVDPGFTMAEARIGYTLVMTATDPVSARPYLEKAFARSQNLTESDRLHIAAWYAVACLDYPEAIQRYRELLAADPSELETYGRLGRLLRGEERREEAIEILKQGLTWDPNSTDILNILGAIYSQLGRHEEAIAAEQKYVTLSPDEANAHDSLGLAYHWAGRHGDAEREYQRALALKPDFEVAFRHLGALYLQTGRYRAAIREMERGTRMQPEGKTDYLQEFVSIARAQLGEWDRVREDGRRRSQPFLLALAAIHTGDWREAGSAATALSQLQSVNRGERPAWRRAVGYFRGRIALGQNHPDEAIADFQHALRRWPHWSDALWFEDCLADAYLKLGRLDDAIAEYQRALRLYPGMGLARFHLAEAYRGKGDRGRAATEYRRFLDLWRQADPGIPEAAAARAQLAN